MPEHVRSVVQEWHQRHRKAFISVVDSATVPMQEDARVTVVNLLNGMVQSERVAGEWAGLTKLSPTGSATLPPHCVAVCSGFFLGVPWLTIYQSPGQSGKQLTSAAVPAMVAPK